MSFGPNVHGQFVKNRARLFDWMGEAQCSVGLFMDDRGGALQARKLLPDAAIIHRGYNGGDHRWHKDISPQQFYDRFAREAEGGIIVQCLNEPSPDARGVWDWSALAEWTAAVMDRFGAAGLSLALPNFGTGSPHESPQSLAALDPMWAALKRWKHLHYYAAHGYGTLNGMTYTDETHSRDVVPYRIGREAKWIIPYCQEKHGFTPRVIQTEFGADMSFYAGDDKSKSGWRSYPWTEDRYADELIKADQHDNHPWMVGRCIFSYGNSAGKWWAFDIEDALTLQRRLIEYSQSQPQQEQPPMAAIPTPGPYDLKMSEPFNVRSTHSTGSDSFVLFTVKSGDHVTVLPEAPVAEDGYTWCKIRPDGSAKEGWIAASHPGIEFVPFVAPPPVVIEPPAPEPAPVPTPPGMPATGQMEALLPAFRNFFATLEVEADLASNHFRAISQLCKGMVVLIDEYQVKETTPA